MSMIDALRFLTRCRCESDFCSLAPSQAFGDRFLDWATDQGYCFSDREIADAFMSFLYRAVDDEEVEELDGLRAWYQEARGFTPEQPVSRRRSTIDRQWALA